MVLSQKEDFLEVVKRYTRQGLTAAAAVQKAMRTHPHAHKEFLKHNKERSRVSLSQELAAETRGPVFVQTGQIDFGRGGRRFTLQEGESRFEELVRKHEEGGNSRAKAMQLAQAENPAAHEEWIRKQQRRR